MSVTRACVTIGAMLLVASGVGAEAALPRDRVPPSKPTIDHDSRIRELRPTFSFAATDRRTPPGRIRFRCAFDTAPMSACARVHRPGEDLSFGRHVLRVQALDLAGNASRVAIRQFTVQGFWDAAADFQRGPSQANPGRDKYGNATWFYLYSPNPEHIPDNYRPLPFFVVLDPGTEVWRNQADGMGGSQAGFSFNRITMHPGQWNIGQNAILGWRSPVAGMVLLQADINANQTNCSVGANGVAWSIDQGASTLQSGVLRPGELAHPRVTVSVVPGDMLYLVMNDAGESSCDGTFSTVTVETTGA